MSAARVLNPALGLLVVWLALARSLSVGQVIGGVVAVALALAVVPVGDAPRLRWAVVPRLVGRELVAVARSTISVLRATLSTRRPPAGVVDVHLPGSSGSELAWLGALLTLTPGTYVVDLDEPSQVLRAHVLDATRLDDLVADVVLLRRDVRALFGLGQADDPSVTLVEGPR